MQADKGRRVRKKTPQALAQQVCYLLNCQNSCLRTSTFAHNLLSQAQSEADDSVVKPSDTESIDKHDPKTKRSKDKKAKAAKKMTDEQCEVMTVSALLLIIVV